MRAVWYERQGDARDVLVTGEVDRPSPGPGEVRVRVAVSGVNPGDVKKRQGWLGSAMPYPRVVPHSDGAGTVDAVGEGVDPARVGERVWVYGAQSYRPFGTAAQFVAVPAALAVPLPDGVPDDLGASVGIPGITAHRAVFADGPVTGRIVLVHGVLGAVGGIAAQLAVGGGAEVVGTVRKAADVDRALAAGIPNVVVLGDAAADAVRAVAPRGVDRIVEVALSANAALDAAVIAEHGVVAAYGSPDPEPRLPFWPLLFANVTLRLLGSDDFPVEAKVRAAADLTAAMAGGRLAVPVAARFPLAATAAAHEAVERPAGSGKVLVDVD
jgi:NADPH2:quinone reductase